MAVLLTTDGSYDLDADAARRARLELRAAILDEPACWLLPRAPAPGDRGALHDLIVEVGTASGMVSGTAGVIALTRIVSLWLHRDRRRTITITSTRDGNATRVTVTGESIALSTIETAVRQALGPDPEHEEGHTPDGGTGHTPAMADSTGPADVHAESVGDDDVHGGNARDG